MLGEHVLAGMDVLVLCVGAIIAGLYILVKGGNWTIDAGVSLAHRFNMPAALVGFTVIAFGTSLPELVVSMNANLKGFPGISVGNVVGSNIANILLIIGLSAMVAPVIANLTAAFKRDLFMMGASSVALCIMMQQAMITQMQGGLMVLALITFVVYQYRQYKKTGEGTVDAGEPVYDGAGKAVFFLLLGLATLVIGAEILVSGAVTSARMLGVPDAVIGLTIVAVGTSLPELVTCLIAVRKGQSDIVIGNIVGSNVFNILSIVGLVAFASGIPVDSVAPRMASLDVWIMLGVSLAYAAYLLVFKRMGFVVGSVMVALYAAFTIEQYLNVL